MKIEEKVKRYDEAIKKAAALYKASEPMSGCNVIIETLFPELKESEDERIRKELLEHCKNQAEAYIQTGNKCPQIQSWIAWLEKQNEQIDIANKEYWRGYREGKKFILDKYTEIEKQDDQEKDILEDTILDGNEDGLIAETIRFKKEKQSEQKAGYTTIVKTGDGGINALVTRELPTDGEQKPTDGKVMKEFGVGDWLVENGVNRSPVQITSFEEDKEVGIKVWFSNGTGTYIEFLKGYHKWTLEDAKDGDVLCYETENELRIFIYKNGHIHYHCCYYNGHLTTIDSFFVIQKHLLSYVHPATKEQRDLLFQNMEEAGYEWDAKKKELKKIEQNPTDKIEPKFKVGDWVVDKNGIVKQILSYKDGVYKHTDGYSAKIFEEEWRLWDITKDAKNGDVLHSTGLYNDYIFIFNGLDYWKFNEPNGDRAVATAHCCLSVSADNMEFGIQGPDCIEVNTIKPAIKIQRNLLFQKMREAGYEWDAEKKELIKIIKVDDDKLREAICE